MIESLVFINVLVCNIVTRYLNSFVLCAEFFQTVDSARSEAPYSSEIVIIIVMIITHQTVKFGKSRGRASFFSFSGIEYYDNTIHFFAITYLFL